MNNTWVKLDRQGAVVTESTSLFPRLANSGRLNQTDYSRYEMLIGANNATNLKSGSDPCQV
jgi:hypothetical protein